MPYDNSGSAAWLPYWKRASAEDLLEIILRRYERVSTLLTSNRPVEDWGNLLGDGAASARKGWVDFGAVKQAVRLEAVLRHYQVAGLHRHRDQLQGCRPIHRGKHFSMAATKSNTLPRA